MALSTHSGWAPFERAIVDIGALVSLIPRDVWKGIQFTGIAKVEATGVINRPECRVPAELATVEYMISDGRARIGPLRMHAMLADSDRVPLLLGMSGCL